jgi:hypothetical protein
MLYIKRGGFVLSALFLTAALHAQTVTVTPSWANVGLGKTVQFTKATTMLSPDTVTWAVAGVVGGNSTVGTIDTNGLYTAPSMMPANSTPLVSATSTAMPSVKGLGYANIQPPGPTITAVNPNPLAVGNFTVKITGSGFASGAMIMASGVQLSTTFVNATAITAGYYQGPATSATFCVKNPGTDCGNTIVVPIAAKAVFSGPTISISPAGPSVAVNTSVQMTAATTGLNDSSVTWSVGGVVGGTTSLGKITAAGVYTAPATVPSQSPWITATSTMDPSTSATVYVNVLKAGPTITMVTPNPIPSGNVTVTVTGTGSPAFVTGSMIYVGGVQLSTIGTPTATSISASAYVPSSTSTTVCVRNPSSACSNTLVIPVTAPVQNPNPNPNPPPAPNPAPVVAPATVTLALGSTQQFTASNVTSWTVSAGGGAVDGTGLYTAPAVMPSPATVIVTATNAGGSGKATVTLVPNTPPAITGINPQSLPLGVFSFSVQGTSFVAQSVVQLNGKSLPTTYVPATSSLNVTGFAGTSGPGTLIVVNGPLSSQPFPVQVGVANPAVSAAAARRFLEQGAFGPTPTDADHVQSVGYQAWLTEQLNMPPISNYNGVGSQGGMPTIFLANAVTNADQLRQRVSFALSQIFVTSLTKLIWNTTMIPYQQMLTADAFTNYRKLLGDVTLSPAMGNYLDMANNAKANPAAGTVANENYAREVLQLFSIGTSLLNGDGSVQKDASNNALPAYDQATIAELARVFTGWTYAPIPGGQPQWNAYLNNTTSPMVFMTAYHDAGTKTLFGGFPSTYTVASGQSPDVELNHVLDVIASHPNVAPFISKQLIQHLVKSNPSPAYVQRVVNAWNQSNGDMKTVITTILLDTEARADDDGLSQTAADGHLQEPALFLPGIVRAFGGQMTPANFYANDMAAMGEDLYNAPSVFNYYSPGYTVANTGGLKGPEFQIYNPNNAILRENLIANLFNQYSNPIASYGPGTTIDLTPLLPLSATPATLVDAIDLILTHGLMPAAMKSTIVATVTGDANGSLHRVQTAIYLTLQSSFYSVWH